VDVQMCEGCEGGVDVWMCVCGCEYGCVDVCMNVWMCVRWGVDVWMCVWVWMCVDVCDVCSENVCGNACDMDVCIKKGKVILKVVFT